MASVIKDPRGFKRVQWCVGDGERRTLRLGIASVRQAEAVRVRVEQLLAAQSTGVLDAEAGRWVETLEDAMHKKLSHLGLIKPRDRHVATLGQLLDSYFETLNVKPGTRRTYEQTRQELEGYFGATRALESITPLDCDRWAQSMRAAELAAATVAKRVKTARQVFKQAIKWKLMADNPLTEVKAGASTNRARMYFVSREDTQKVLAACPDAEWRAIIALSRFGGLRCPSETLPLTWEDVDWDEGLLHVRSCKTEAYEGGDRRTVPLFPELREALLAAFEQAEDGAEHIITRYRSSSANLRTQMHRIIRRAGLTPWPKPFHNLRSSRQTELSEEFPIQCVCAWLGNSVTVARDHYLQVTDAHLARAIGRTAATGHVAAVGAGTGTGGSAPSDAPGRDVGPYAANGATVAGAPGCGIQAGHRARPIDILR